jgi:hypothetical protein
LLWAFIRAQYAIHKDAPSAERLIEKMQPLFEGFARLLHLTSATRMLPSEEKTEVLGLCRSVPGLLRAARPNTQIKTHMIEFELHEFIEYWGTIGILNEEAFESIHAHQNNMLRRFACVRNRNHRDELMQRAFDVMQRTKAKTDAMVAERRRPKRRKTVP